VSTLRGTELVTPAGPAGRHTLVVRMR
jgi:hypothetical protein